MASKSEMFISIQRASPEDLKKIKKPKEPHKTAGALTIGEIIIPPPIDLEQFEKRLRRYSYELKNLFFGITYETTKKRDTSNESLVDALLEYENYQKKSSFPLENLDAYPLLKLILEKDAPLLVREDYLLGVQRDLSGLSSTQKDTIAIQAAAQVLWHQEKSKIPTEAKMVEILLDDRSPLHDLLELDRYDLDSNSERLYSRTIAKYVGKIFPKPEKKRKGRLPNTPVSNDYFDFLRPIPGITLENGKMLNFPKLRFAIKCLTRILKIFGWTPKGIKDSHFIYFYQKPIPFYLHRFIDDWVEEAFVENGRIFDQ